MTGPPPSLYPLTLQVLLKRTAEKKTTSERAELSVIVTVTETWVKSFFEF